MPLAEFTFILVVILTHICEHVQITWRLPSMSELLGFSPYYFYTDEGGSHQHFEIKLTISSLPLVRMRELGLCPQLLVLSPLTGPAHSSGWFDRKGKINVNAQDLEGRWDLELALSSDLCRELLRPQSQQSKLLGHSPQLRVHPEDAWLLLFL